MKKTVHIAASLLIAALLGAGGLFDTPTARAQSPQQENEALPQSVKMTGFLNPEMRQAFERCMYDTFSGPDGRRSSQGLGGTASSTSERNEVIDCLADKGYDLKDIAALSDRLTKDYRGPVPSRPTGSPIIPRTSTTDPFSPPFSLGLQPPSSAATLNKEDEKKEEKKEPVPGSLYLPQGSSTKPIFIPH